MSVVDLSFRSGFQVRYIGQDAIQIVDSQTFSLSTGAVSHTDIFRTVVLGLVLSGFGVRHL